MIFIKKNKEKIKKGEKQALYMCKRITNKYNRLYCFQFVRQIDEKKG